MNGPPVSITAEPLANPWVGVREMPRTTSALSWVMTSMRIRPSSPALRTFRMAGTFPEGKRTSMTLPRIETTFPWFISTFKAFTYFFRTATHPK